MRPATYAALIEALGELNSTDEVSSQSNSPKRQAPMTTIDKIPGW